MPIDFPPSANTGDIYTEGNYSYEFTGVKWKPVNRVDYTIQASDIAVANNSLVVDFNVDGIQRLTLSEEATVTFANPPAEGEFKKVLIDFSIDPDYIDTNVEYYDIVNSTVETSKSVAAQDSTPFTVFFKSDGTKMYILGYTSSTVYQYALSTAWDVSTATFETGKIKSVTEAGSNIIALFFKPDGEKMYVLGFSNDTVYQYALSTAWDVSTAVFETGKTKSVVAQDSVPYGMFFKPDGTKMYIVGISTDTIYQYALSTAWDVSTAVFETGKTKSVTAQDGSTCGVFFKPDGSKMYIVGETTDTIYQYALSTAWDVSTAVFETGKTKSVTAQESNSHGVFFKPDGTKMYIVGETTDTVYQYNTTTITQDTIANLNWPSTIEWESGAAPSLPNPSETALVVLEARTDYIGTNYVGRLVGRNF